MRYFALVNPDNPGDASNSRDQLGEYYGTLFADAATAEEHRQHLPAGDSLTINEMSARETADWAARFSRDNPDVKTFLVFSPVGSMSLSLFQLQLEASREPPDEVA